MKNVRHQTENRLRRCTRLHRSRLGRRLPCDPRRDFELQGRSHRPAAALNTNPLTSSGCLHGRIRRLLSAVAAASSETAFPPSPLPPLVHKHTYPLHFGRHGKRDVQTAGGPVRVSGRRWTGAQRPARQRLRSARSAVTLSPEGSRPRVKRTTACCPPRTLLLASAHV